MVSHPAYAQQPGPRRRARRRLRALRGELLEKRELLFGDVMGEASVWVALPTMPPSLTGAISYLAVDEYAAWTLNTDALRAELSAAPLEFTAEASAPLTFSLPTPEGNFSRFALIESPIMAPELAAQFPEIKTYAGQGIDDPAATVRLDLTPQGFHAQVLSPAGVYYIDPYYHLENSVHVSYYKSAVNAAERMETLGDPMRAEVAALASYSKPVVIIGPQPWQAFEMGDEVFASEEASRAALLASAKGGTGTSAKAPVTEGEPAAKGGSGTPQERSGTQLRTYRAAVAATAEYTAFHGGTVTLGQAAVVTAMNRVTGVYESELSIRLTLVANNNLLIYTNSSTDPYTNNNPSSLLTENQANIDARIGTTNYDIGHVFSTGGGGLAASGVGIASRKAQGETGSPSPIGDSFYIDYVVHEMGHQFDANHSWSGVTGSCSSDNYYPDTGAEPGSGTTIMSYAGICGADNLASHADPYFHAINFNEIIAYVDNIIPSVGTRSATGNSVPTVNAGNDYAIPINTPFTLTASGSDADVGDVLTYSWEEMDAGPQRLVSTADNGASALFRSYVPTSGVSRTFPPMANVLANTNVTGEKLPAEGRTLDFRVTIRDNRTGGGGVNTDDARIKVINTGAPFRVTSPNTAVHWASKSQQVVTWNVAGTNANGINTSQVNILLSTDGGLTFPTVLAAATPNDGVQRVDLPALSTSSTARIRIEPVGNVYFDVSDVNFFIDAAGPATDFGDAPDSYATLSASNGARHTIGGPRLGSLTDGETNGQPNATGTGDAADEDGVAFLTPLVAGQIATVRVVSSAAGAKLDYFFDFDGNGVFGNAANEIFSATLVAGPQSLSVGVPATATIGSSFARFRISTAGGLGPTGLAADGEVEDYRIAIFVTAPALDFGDAPDSYGTLAASSGPAHVASSLRLGTVLDSEANATASTLSTGDGVDEDGVKFDAIFFPGSSSNISVTASAAGVLDYFFDFDGSGVFGDQPNEIFQSSMTAGANSLLIAVPPAAITGITAARFRLSTAGNLSPYGLALDGEVEDYQIRIVTVSTVSTFEKFDSVTAPALPAGWTNQSTVSSGATVNWVTANSSTNSDTTPNHVFVPAASKTSTNRLTSPTFLVTSANQQIRFQQLYDHEYLFDGGVLEISVNGGTFTDFVTAGGTFVSGGYTTVLDAAANLASRNSWSGPSSGYYETTILLPASAVGQNVALRWIEGTDSSTGNLGWRIDSIETVRTALAFDYGDAPAPYPTTSASSGAAHAQETTLKLGTNFDTEANGTASATANADDGNGADDEDGVTIGTIQQGSNSSVTVVASGSGLLQGWIDFNDDGDWVDSGEQIFLDQPVIAGTNNLSFAVGSGAIATTQTFARFRLSSQAGLSVTGQAPDGEVEDYEVAIAAAPVTFVVSATTPTSTGFVLDFNRDLDPTTLNLYDASGTLGAADVTLTGATVGAVRGSVVLDPNARRLTFVATAGRLAADTYSISLRSAADGFRDTTAALLDGDANGTTGGNFSTNFTVSGPPANAVTISAPNFARGPGQAINVPADVTTGLPISFSDGSGITAATFELRYNPALLTISGATVAPGLPPTAAVTLNTATPGIAIVQFISSTPLASGTTRFIDLQTSVPSSAIYLAKEILDIGNISLNAGAIPGLDDDAVHVAAYFGDVTGNGGYSSSDASLLARNAVGLDSGFAVFKLLDPMIIGDINGNGSFSALDTAKSLQLAVGIAVAEAPSPLPSAFPTLGGPDPKLSIPSDLVASAGDAVSIPVYIDSVVDLTGHGLSSGELVIEYDPILLEVQSVALGSLLSNQTGSWFVNSRIDTAAGRVSIAVAGTMPLEGKFVGEMVRLKVKVKTDAPAGPTAINLVAATPDATVRTQLNEGHLTLIPPPRDAADEVGVDGQLRIRTQPMGPLTLEDAALLEFLADGPDSSGNPRLSRLFR